ncbi:hypothetical protein GOEFS_076_00370 [Gordonia effusa NBRC 100432]|uniref:DUF6779 domain-containing protein n=1 Tax=Gordonia effusa NBRC 100432 TaxID=1077974 RepID=H0R2A7_9ACTN|nr:hypothetical protein GOEFS_076_00370 [Gordonia effusa NBRC 100432]
MLGLLILLALVASVLMVFVDKLTVAASIAVIAALWAAVIGAILVTKFRRQADTAEAKSRDLRLVYELQLEREITARRQYELDVETTIRKEVAAESGHELLELQAQVAALRASLEVLIGEPLPEDRVALPNEKLRELASGIGTNLYEPDDRVRAAHDFASTAPATADGRHQPSDSPRYDIPRADANDMTEIIPVVTDDDEIISTQFEQVNPEPEPHPFAQAYSAYEQVDPNEPQFTEDAPTDAWQTEPEASAADAEAELEDSVGRHDDGAGVPFSQLLSQLQQSSSPAGRRRKED